ncbi:DDE-type integrase/transposase/recombinase, partial [Streptomyces sp. NPDC005009]
MGSTPPSYRGHRYPVEAVSHCVWPYHRFPLIFREVERLMFQRGVIVSYETVRRWCAEFDQDGSALDTLLRPRRDAKATRRFFRRLMKMKKTRAVPRVIVTDKLRSHGAAHRKAVPSVEH